MTPLQRLVIERVGGRGLTYRDAASQSGGLVTHGTLNNIALGKCHIDGLRHRTRKGIALALDLPQSTVDDAWEKSRTSKPAPFELPKNADRLNTKQRRAVLAVISALLDA